MTPNVLLAGLAMLTLAVGAHAQDSYAVVAAPAAHTDQIWIPGQWIWTGNAYVWQPGAWRSAPPSQANDHPDAVWVEGRWQQGPEGWVWNPGHFETQSAYASVPPPPAPAPTETVVYQSAPETVVYDQTPATVIVGGPLCPSPVIYRQRAVCEPVAAQRPHGNVDISVGVALGGHGGPAPHIHPFLPLPPLPPLRLLDPLFFLHHHH